MKMLNHFIKNLKIMQLVADGMEFIKGKNASAIARKLVDPKEHEDETAKEATLRLYIPKVLGRKPDMTKNIVHASDSAENGVAEVARYREMRKKYLKQNGKEL